MLREQTVPSMREHADSLEQQLERYGADEPMVSLGLTDDLFLHSFNGARWQLGIPVPVDNVSIGPAARPASAVST